VPYRMATAAVDPKVPAQFQRRAHELLVQRHTNAKRDERRAEAAEDECGHDPRGTNRGRFRY